MVLVIIQARRGSTRLPDKAFADIGGKPMIQRVVERARQIRGIDDLVVAVPYGQREDFRFDCAVTKAPNVPENDVLARFAIVAGMFPQHTTIARITGDCPLFNPTIAERVLQLYRDAHAWYAWNVHPGYTDGEDVEVFKREALMRAHREATDPSDREHVTPWLRRNYPVVTLKPTGPQQRKTSIDTLEDLEHVRRLVAQSR